VGGAPSAARDRKDDREPVAFGHGSVEAAQGADILVVQEEGHGPPRLVALLEDEVGHGGMGAAERGEGFADRLPLHLDLARSPRSPRKL